MVQKYAPIWEALKRDRKVTLAVPIPIQKRILKAVISMKDRDLGFKFIEAELGKKSIICYKLESARIRILLRKYPLVNPTKETAELYVEDF